MGTRGRRFRLGLFVLGTAAMFLALLTFILDNTLRSERAAYYIMFEENVKGMVIGSKVNFQGVPVGVVCDMRFQDGKTLVELSVDPTRSTIQDVTKARMDRLLVTGQVTVELEGYDRDGKLLPPGSVIETTPDPLSALKGSIPEVVDRATAVLARLDTLLVSADAVLGDDNRTKVATILDNLVAASANLRERTLPAAEALLDEGRVLAANGQQLVADAREATKVLTRLEPELVAALRDGEAFMREATALAGSLRAPAQAALGALRQTLADVRSLARQLELAPDSLLFGIKRPAAPFGGNR